MIGLLRNLALSLTACLLVLATAPAPAAEPAASYSMDDFAKVRKYDAHVHSNSKSQAFLEQARAESPAQVSLVDGQPAQDDRRDRRRHVAADRPGRCGVLDRSRRQRVVPHHAAALADHEGPRGLRDLVRE